jgi:hypothetical protein
MPKGAVLPVGLRGPVDVALARAADVVPSTLAGDTPVFDLKFDPFLYVKPVTVTRPAVSVGKPCQKLVLSVRSCR